MKKDIKRNRRPGFTLVELLIVIIIIGILAGGMMLVAGGSTDKANATKIVSDLRTLKSAALMYYSDNNKWPTAANMATDFKPYIDKDFTGFALASDDQFVGYTGDLIKNTGVQGALKKMAKESGLYGGTAGPTTAAGDYDSEDGVWMRLR
ncbi:type II secretion system protein [Dethiosulfovibrio salsuginis]|uniref:General secretion pathway protein G n=1 Tax=Dethiosulfovibrio salsuginis TaxID=561720 RepID=A0A1X7I165_9BACT|nr:prepilin-type N-terminal cleavage/methylation domain-containing protein [Dethiosulfovibrio salsuginis]SMG08055.1 general secretion pathway protein G [Dethiosulfovibrio salsuginis]